MKPTPTLGAILAFAALAVCGWGFLSRAAQAESREFRATGEQPRGPLSVEDAQALAVAKARLKLADQIGTAAADLAPIKTLHLTIGDVQSAALGLVRVSVRTGSEGASETATLTADVDLRRFASDCRKASIDPDLAERFRASRAVLTQAAASAGGADAARIAGSTHHYLSGLAALASGNLVEAESSFTQALMLDPGNADALSGRGSVRVRLGKWNDGLADLDKAVVLNPKASAPLRARAQTLLARLQYQAAEEDLTRAVALNPLDAAALGARGELRAAVRSDSRALQDLDEAVRLAPIYAGAHQARAEVMARLQRFASALREYERALELDPDSAATWNNLGNLHSRMGDLSPALKDYDAALRLDGSLAAAYNNRGEVHRALGDLAAAIADYDQAIRLRPSFANAYLNRAAAFEGQGKPEQALKDLDYVAHTSPEKPSLYVSRAAAYARIGLPSKACEDWKRACELGERSVCEFIKAADPCKPKPAGSP